jgi:DNA-binding response OmpR family regulator
MDAILLEADDIIVKPFDAGKLAELVRNKLLTGKPAAPAPREMSGRDIAASHQRDCRR